MAEAHRNRSASTRQHHLNSAKHVNCKNRLTAFKRVSAHFLSAWLISAGICPRRSHSFLPIPDDSFLRLRLRRFPVTGLRT